MCNEEKTPIVPLMHGGELMAFEMSKALKPSEFVYSRQQEDINQGRSEGKRTIVLVDSVVNSVKSIIEYLVPLRDK